MVILYNSALVSWSLFYFVQSFDYPLSWDHCPLVENFSRVGEERDRGMQKIGATPCETACKYGNLSAPSSDFSCLWIEPHQYFWYHTVLRASNQIEEDIEVLVLSVTLCLCATWIFLYVTMVIRIKISVLVSAPMATFFLGLGVTSVPGKSPTKEAIPTSRKLCDPASWLPPLCRNLIYLSSLLDSPWVPAFPGFTVCTLVCTAVLLSSIYL